MAAVLIVDLGADRGAMAAVRRLTSRAGAVREPGVFWTADGIPSAVWVLPTRGSADRLSRRIARSLPLRRVLVSRAMSFERYLVEGVLRS